jgi:hypothetical protein
MSGNSGNSGNLDYQLKKPPVQCPHCGRWFKHNGYYIRHDRDSMISCVTKIRIAENDRKERERIKEITSNREPGYYRKRWYEKNREKVLQQKKEWYAENSEAHKSYYWKNRETISQKKKEWYIKNAENLKALYQKKKKIDN